MSLKRILEQIINISHIKILLIAACLSFFTSSVVLAAYSSQLQINYEVPDGWVAQENGEGIVITSDLYAGLMVIVPHEYHTVSQLLGDPTNQSIIDAGVQLYLENPFEVLDQSSVKAWYSGTMNGIYVHVLAVARVFDNATGYTAMLALPPAQFTNNHQVVLMQTAFSLKHLVKKQEHQSPSLFANSSSSFASSNVSGKSQILVNDAQYPLYRKDMDAFGDMLEFTLNQLGAGSMEQFGGRNALVKEAIKNYSAQPLESKRAFSMVEVEWRKISQQLSYMSVQERNATARELLVFFTVDAGQGYVTQNTKQNSAAQKSINYESPTHNNTAHRDRPSFNTSQNGSVVVGNDCVYASVPGLSMSSC